MKKIVVLLVVLLLSLTACGDKSQVEEVAYADGQYTAESSKDEWGGKLVVNIIVENGKITVCEQQNLDGDGNEKAEDYGKIDGKITNPGLYNIAQAAVENANKYPKMLIDTQDINQVEVISGATVSYNAFVEAVNKALEQSKK